MSRIELRPYQEDALKAVFDYWAKGGGNPLVEMATGTGKSMVIAKLVRDCLEQYPTMRVLMLTHVKELVAQNFTALKRVWPDAPAGIYSAGLRQYDPYSRIVFANIQSVFKKSKALGERHLIVIDESHLVPGSDDGMYRKLLTGLHNNCPDARVVGFTATPYRLDSGRLDTGEVRLFDKIVYSYAIGRGIEEGYLAPLKSRASLTEIDVKGVAKKGGEFVPASLATASGKITAAAVEEIMTLGQGRKSWLIFCAGVDHAINVRNALRAAGVRAETVTGQTPNGERDSIIRRFKAGEIQALTNANVLTTGFDAPAVDLIAMLRPTLSTGLYVQMVGRGTRQAAGKQDCLVLDFAGNIRRHGPVDSVSISPRGGKAKSDEARVNVEDIRAKECPKCKELVAINARTCKWCGHEWPVNEKPKHEEKAEKEVGILSSEKVPPTQLPVVHWGLSIHYNYNQGKPNSLRVNYLAGVAGYTEWVGIEHGGFFGQKAKQWWVAHGGKMPFPDKVEKALLRKDELTMPATISVRPRGKYHDIVARTFAPLKELTHD